MIAPVLRSGTTLSSTRDIRIGLVASGVILRPVEGDRDGDRDPMLLITSWRPSADSPSRSGVVVTQVRDSRRPDRSDHELSLESGYVLLTEMRIGSTPAEEVLDTLAGATDRFLGDSSAVEGLAFAVSPDGSRIVEVLRVADPESLHEAQADPRMRDHIARVARMTGSMEPRLYRVTQVVADGEISDPATPPSAEATAGTPPYPRAGTSA